MCLPVLLQRREQRRARAAKTRACQNLMLKGDTSLARVQSSPRLVSNWTASGCTAAIRPRQTIAEHRMGSRRLRHIQWRLDVVGSARHRDARSSCDESRRE